MDFQGCEHPQVSLHHTITQVWNREDHRWSHVYFTLNSVPTEVDHEPLTPGSLVVEPFSKTARESLSESVVSVGLQVCKSHIHPSGPRHSSAHVGVRDRFGVQMCGFWVRVWVQVWVWVKIQVRKRFWEQVWISVQVNGSKSRGKGEKVKGWISKVQG